MTQSSLFHGYEHIPLPGVGAVVVCRNWIGVDESAILFDHLLRDISWTQPELIISGRKYLTPRLQAWYGIKKSELTYSGVTFTAKTMPVFLTKLTSLVSNLTSTSFASTNLASSGFISPNFNSVLINHYRNQHDSVAWHADDEPEFGPAPVIASLSLGATRRFSLKPKPEFIDKCHWHKGKRAINFELNDGDLLIMNEGVQGHWVHAVQKQRQICGDRMNLTFRHVYSKGDHR